MILLLLLVLLLAGCGDNNINPPGSAGPIPAQPAPVVQNAPPGGFVGRFQGFSDLGGVQQGFLELTTQANGNAAGTLTVTGGGAGAAVPPGVYVVTGSFEVGTGLFSLSGNVETLGFFTATGTLPAGMAAGNYVLRFVNGRLTFTGFLNRI